MITTNKINTSFLQLTELWLDGDYRELGLIMNEESWSIPKVAEFCSYFAKYVGLKELSILYKFL
jgi:hypothetical protein